MDRCPVCGFTPQTDEEKAKSLMLSLHYEIDDEYRGKTKKELELVAAGLRAGKPYPFDPREVQDVIAYAHTVLGIPSRVLILDGIKWLAPVIALLAILCQFVWMQMSPMWLVVLVAVSFGAGWLIVRLLAARAAAEYRVEAQRDERTSALSRNEAASRVDALLADPTQFECTESALPDDERSIERLTPELRTLLRRYESIALVRGRQVLVSRSSVGASKHHTGYVRVGVIADGDAEIGVREGEETIYELYAGEAPDPTFGTYRTIYHFLLSVAGEEGRA